MENGKGISNCPDELADFINELNFLPATREELDALEKDTFSLDEKTISELIDKNFFEIKALSDAKGLINKKFQLRKLIAEKYTLLDILFDYEMWNIDFNRQKDHTFTIRIGGSFTKYEGKTQIAIGFNDNTSLNLPGLRSLYLFIKYPVERVRTCPICQNIFWAKRIESPACSSQHVLTFNSAKTRIKESERLLKTEIEILKKAEINNDLSLVEKQKSKVNKLAAKIKERKIRYRIF